jgi:hypothetical protein
LYPIRDELSQKTRYRWKGNGLFVSLVLQDNDKPDLIVPAPTLGLAAFFDSVISRSGTNTVDGRLLTTQLPTKDPNAGDCPRTPPTTNDHVGRYAPPYPKIGALSSRRGRLVRAGLTPSNLLALHFMPLLAQTGTGFVESNPSVLDEERKMSGTVREFERLLGNAALRLWPDLPRDVQENCLRRRFL